MPFSDTIDVVGKALDVLGVLAIFLGVAYATVLHLRRHGVTLHDEGAFRRYRHGLGRAILVGLEILVAADIIRTVAVAPTFESAGVLAVIVGIRTLLSFSLEVELEGRWPWRRERSGEGGGA